MIHRDEDGKYTKWAWPGAYPVFHVVADGGVPCAKCANEHSRRNDPECPDDDQWRVVASDVNWNDPELFCDHCNERIESAYAGDEAESDN